MKKLALISLLGASMAGSLSDAMEASLRHNDH